MKNLEIVGLSSIQSSARRGASGKRRTLTSRYDFVGITPISYGAATSFHFILHADNFSVKSRCFYCTDVTAPRRLIFKGNE